MYLFLDGFLHDDILLPGLLCPLYAKIRDAFLYTAKHFLNTVVFYAFHIVHAFVPSNYFVLAAVDDWALVEKLDFNAVHYEEFLVIGFGLCCFLPVADYCIDI